MDKKNCFVIMPFSKYEDVYNNVYKSICDELDVKCIRVDEIAQPGQIMEDVLNNIKSADMIIADISSNNPNVFYELGYAHALSFNNVIVTRYNNDDKIPFDVTGLRQVFYDFTPESLDNLRDRVKKFIKNLMDEHGSAYACVKYFYTHLSHKNYENAFKLLSSDFRKQRWNNNLSSFKEGYIYTDSIVDLSIRKTKVDAASAEIFVNYTDKTDAPLFDCIDQIYKKKVKDLSNIIKIFDSFKNELKEHNYDVDVFDNLILFQLISPTNSSKLAWLLKTKSKEGFNIDVDKTFTQKQIVKEFVSCNVYLTKIENKWYIDKIRHIDSY